MPAVDVWGINSYRGISFGDLFTSWQAVSNKPMFLAEFGADSYNANTKAYDPDSQAKATAALLREISAQASYSGGIALGGTIFEWADEWWKDSAGNPDVHEVGGIAPGGGPYPDQTFKEWWGAPPAAARPLPNHCPGPGPRASYRVAFRPDRERRLPAATATAAAVFVFEGSAPSKDRTCDLGFRKAPLPSPPSRRRCRVGMGKGPFLATSLERARE